jgi:signal transduction histidine kinase
MKCTTAAAVRSRSRLGQQRSANAVGARSRPGGRNLRLHEPPGWASLDGTMDVSDPTAPRVLLVDDTPANLTSLVAVLRPIGAELVEARSGPEAIELVAQNWFAAILMDVQMPGMDGFEAATRIRATERGREVPILFLTAIHRGESYAVRGYEVGAADYITKPFDIAVVRARVKAFVDLFRQRDRQRRQHLENALAFAPALVSIFRVSDRSCEFANAALRRLFGQRAVVGSSAEDLGATPEMMALFDRVVATGKPLELTEHVLTVGRVERVFNMTLQPLWDDQGSVDAVVLFAIDVTEPVRARAAVEQARARAEHANRVKDDFLAIASHELRTPLSSILGWAANARRKNASSEVERALGIIERNARTQARLIDDILDVSRIVAGHLRLELAKTDLGAAIAGTVESLRPAAEAKTIALTSKIGDLGLVNADPERIQQVIWNVISNAIKFSADGGHVEVTGVRFVDRVLVQVTDSGEGLDPSSLPHLFEPFWQGDASTTRRHGGLGLGLAIASQIVKAHGGIIRASSEGKGHGTSIAIELPISSASEKDRRATRDHAVTAGENTVNIRLDDLRLLVVDDDEDTRLLLRDIFADHGAVVTCVSSAREALTELQHGRSDVMISDIGMPDVDGFALMRQVRRLSRDEGGHTPAIALTAYSRSEDAVRAIAAGYQLHAVKPVNAAVLLSSVAALAGRRA